MTLVATVTVALSQPTEEPLQASVDSDLLRGSTQPSSLEVAFCSSCCVTSHVPLALFTEEKKTEFSPFIWMLKTFCEWLSEQRTLS